MVVFSLVSTDQPRLNHSLIKLKVVQSNVAGLRSATEIINSKGKERNFI